MDEVPTTVEYSPQPMGGMVEFRRTDAGAIITLRPYALRMWPKIIGSALLSAFGIALLLLFVIVMGEFHWGSLTFPLVFVALGIAGGLGNLWPYFFPIVL